MVGKPIRYSHTLLQSLLRFCSTTASPLSLRFDLVRGLMTKSTIVQLSDTLSSFLFNNRLSTVTQV
jgi:hypothetical protein